MYDPLLVVTDVSTSNQLGPLWAPFAAIPHTAYCLFPLAAATVLSQSQWEPFWALFAGNNLN